ncbi:MAG: SusC/RagA family TonB-linked outer membrane protein [Marinilabiliales bacterium]|nr:MAG: SusC/RagA family TonB-linked outer membrane protein [Marinilabiliales bacterium]
MAQVSISGKIVESKTGLGLPGANVMVKGTETGTVANIDGEFSIEAKKGDVLIISFIGFISKEIVVGDDTNLIISLDEDTNKLDEIVIVGYGSQRKSVVTGAISSIKASELEEVPILRVDDALQGRTSGVVVAANSGQPGSSATVRVRGITSLNDGANEPLWVVDGVVVDKGGIGYLSQSDIASIEVLKDASSQAIYGARAAAGVILITTKKGTSGELKVTYNGFYGTSSPAKKLNLTNAQQYVELNNESYINGGQNPLFDDPSNYGVGTDWQSEIFNQAAKRQNHELSISGGNDISTFYTSFGYWNQEGIVATDISNYERFNVRINSEHKVTKWLTFGENVGYSHQKSVGLGNTNSEFGGPLSSAINLDPITPVIVTDPDVLNTAPYSNQPDIIRDANGNPYGISKWVGQEMANPLAYIQTRLGNYGWSDDFVGNVYAEIKIIKGLKIRSTVGSKIAFWGYESFTPVSYLNSTTINSKNSFSRGSNRGFNFNVENTISYANKINKHDFEVLLGHGAYQDDWSVNVNVTKWDIPATSFDEASMNWSVPTDQITAGGGEGTVHKVLSLFSRINYNYDGKYLLTAVFRRDGSSRFGSNNRFGFFPSASAGWIVSQENFWPVNNVVNFVKIRGGYGVVGNDNIGNFAYLSTVGGGRDYPFGTSGDYYNGVSPNAPSNPDLRWEETTQINVGFESRFFDRISLTFDWFNKKSTDILMYPRIPAYVGAIGNPAANVASVANRGVELELGYRENFNGLELGVNGNVSYLQNEVTYLGAGVDFLGGGGWFQASSYNITRTQVGQPMNSFYGFEILGVFQNQDDIYSHVDSRGDLIQPNAQPGDFIWADINDDGVITEDDRTFIGNPTPAWTYGITLNASYKNFDLLVFAQGVAGNMIFQGLRRLDIANANYPIEAMDRWTGEGTSNDYPRLVYGDPNHNFSYPSSFYLEKGNYFRFKTIQVGYTLPSKLLKAVKIEKLRVYVTAENLITITNYTGYDPEIGGGIMSIDKGYYPQAKSFMIGVSLNL